MDKVVLKKYIKSFAWNVGLANLMLATAVMYLPVVIQGKGLWILVVCDGICVVLDTCFAINDWKKIKAMLTEENTNVEE